MKKNYSRFVTFTYLLIAGICLPAGAFAQDLIIERELIGAPVAYSVNDGAEDLQVDASFGEPIIGYEEGALIVTIGFHQTGLSGTPAPGIGSEEGEEIVEVDVTAYPNPAVERLVVNMGEHSTRFSKLQLINVNGIPVRSSDVGEQTQIVWESLGNFPDGNYYLQGIGTDGLLYPLGSVLIINR